MSKKNQTSLNSENKKTENQPSKEKSINLENQHPEKQPLKPQGLSRIMRLGRWCSGVDAEEFEKCPNNYAAIGFVSLLCSIVLSVFSWNAVGSILGGYSFIAAIVVWFLSIKLLPIFWYWYQSTPDRDKEWDKLSWDYKFGIWCSGADPKIIKQSQEFSHYKNVGWTVFSAALLSSVAGGYAISTIWVEPIWLPLLGGFIWGFVIIMNIDRLLLSTYNKAETPFNWKQPSSYIAPLMRIGLSFLIALTISYPLEIAIFSNQINDKKDEIIVEDFNKQVEQISQNIPKIEAKRDSALAKFERFSNEQADWTEFSPEAQRLITEQKECKQQLDSLIERNKPAREQIQKRINEAYAQTELVYDDIKKKYNSRLTKIGRDLMTYANNDAKELNDNEKELKIISYEISKKIDALKVVVLSNKDILKANVRLDIDNQEKALNAERLVVENQKKEKRIKIKTSKNGLPGDIEALQRLEEDNTSARWTGRLLMLIFVVVEVLPFLAKIFSSASIYDKVKAKAKESLDSAHDFSKDSLDLAYDFFKKNQQVAYKNQIEAQEIAYESVITSQKDAYEAQKEAQIELNKLKLADALHLLKCEQLESNKEILLKNIENQKDLDLANIIAQTVIEAEKLNQEYQMGTLKMEKEHEEKLKQLEITAKADKEKLKKEIELLSENLPEYDKLMKEKAALLATEHQIKLNEEIAINKLKQDQILHEHQEKLKQEQTQYKNALAEKLQEIKKVAEDAQQIILTEYETLMQRATTREQEFFVQQEKLAEAYLADYKKATAQANENIIAEATKAQERVAKQEIETWEKKQ